MLKGTYRTIRLINFAGALLREPVEPDYVLFCWSAGVCTCCAGCHWQNRLRVFCGAVECLAHKTLNVMIEPVVKPDYVLVMLEAPLTKPVDIQSMSWHHWMALPTLNVIIPEGTDRTGWARECRSRSCSVQTEKKHNKQFFSVIKNFLSYKKGNNSLDQS